MTSRSDGVNKGRLGGDGQRALAEDLLTGLTAAEGLLSSLASIFYPADPLARSPVRESDETTEHERGGEEEVSDVAAYYRILVEQIPAVVFLAYLDRDLREAYVSPHIEALLGFTQEEWLNDPVRWYQQIHPDDKARWSIEAAQMLLTGEPLRSVYRVMARDGRVVWFQCEVRMVRRADGRPWFLHGVGFDITELKQTEEALKRREEELRALTSRLLSAQDEERRRIARELHDSTTQNLAALAMNLSLLNNSPTASVDSQSHRILSESLQLAELCSREVRNLSYLLHPPLLDDLGLVSALKSFVAGFIQRTGIAVELEVPPEMGRLRAEVETALFRIVQEGLTNVHRHSGSQRASIRIWLTETEVRLELRDDGPGRTSNSKTENEKGPVRLGVGIPGMRERARQLGGEMEIQLGSGGTTISVTLLLRNQP